MRKRDGESRHIDLSRASEREEHADKGGLDAHARSSGSIGAGNDPTPDSTCSLSLLSLSHSLSPLPPLPFFSLSRALSRPSFAGLPARSTSPHCKRSYMRAHTATLYTYMHTHPPHCIYTYISMSMCSVALGRVLIRTRSEFFSAAEVAAACVYVRPCGCAREKERVARILTFPKCVYKEKRRYKSCAN